MTSNISFFLCLLLVSLGSTAVITGACEKDSQCGGGMCCAVSLWIRSLRMCIPMGQKGEDCHPMSHKVPFFGTRLHHTCPCQPSLFCITTADGKSKCLPPFPFQDQYL
ncbi:prokineticin-2 [Siphateles boraxobius]|uniref:prokineticin-2 n=1 Tax=Siphateles boraxobius TaxID=180520 RepID=UPI004062D7E6